MTKSLPRTGFNSPRFIRLLAELAAEGAATPKTSFAERLSQWLGFTDAIALSGALGVPAAAPGKQASPVPEGLRQPLDAAVARVRAALAESIAADGVSGTGRVRVRLPLPAAASKPGVAPDFMPYRRYYAAHQRDMEAGVGPLRAQAREAVAAVSPEMAQLATLDEVMERAFAERERNLLAGVPQLLEKRFQQRYALHRQTVGDGLDEPLQWMQPGGWLATFCQEMRTVLLAELEVRLQPVLGLVEAAGGSETRLVADAAVE